jgi:hypothetical protein
MADEDDDLGEPDEDDDPGAPAGEEPDEQDEYDEDPEDGTLGDTASDASEAFEELDEDTAKANAGQNPLAEDDHDEPPEDEPEAPAPAPIRPFAQQQPAQPSAAPQATPAAPPAQIITRPTATQPRPASAPQVQVPVKDGSGTIVGYQQLDAAGNIIDQYMVDSNGGRLPGVPWWVNQDGSLALRDETPNENVGLKITIGVGVGLLCGWLGKHLWDDYQSKRS